MSQLSRTRWAILSSALALGALAACQRGPHTTAASPAPAATAAPADTASAVAVVDGTPITRTEYDLFVRELLRGRQQELTPDQKSEVLNQLIRTRLAASQADQQGLENDPDTVSQLALLRMQVLAEADEKKFKSTIEPTDAELHAEYDADLAAMDKTEYHARHILVQTKDEADQIIKRLKGGAKFEDLAKSQSIDPSKSNGGDLGWFTTARMVKPFGDAVKQLKKGEYTQEPVQTQFGWHVIRLEDTRPLTPPPFDQVKATLANNLKAKKWQAHIEEMEKGAKIEKKI